MTGRRKAELLVVVVLAVAATACAAPAHDAWHTPSPSASGTVASLPVQRVAAPVTQRLAAGLVPPTNRWYSGLVFGDEAQPVFPFPLAFAARDDGFAVDLPAVSAFPDTVAAPFGGGLEFGLGATSFEVVRHDPVSVTLAYSDDEGVLGRLTIAEGSPVVAFRADRDVSLEISAPLARVGEGTWEAVADETLFGIHAPGAELDGMLRLGAGSTAQMFAVPEDSSVAAWASALSEPVAEVGVEFAVGEQTATTRLTYGADTVVVPFPGRESPDDCGLGTFPTAYGTAHACAEDSMEWSVPRVRATGSYALDGLDERRRTALVEQLTADIAGVPAAPADTYFGGKWLARTAGFLSLARELDESALADQAADLLWDELRQWVEPQGCHARDARCFAYDDSLRLIVGLTPSFGSEEGNDHHFHYGYFLTAAAELAAYRPEVADELAPVVDALAADIATGAGEGALPSLRVFDPYRGHSWASGLSPFADGNNQESSSEAVAAWNGLALWARVRGDEELGRLAEWMLSAEASAARSLWLEPDLDDLPAGYEHGIVSLTWGGKRDYATWFSPEPSAILGIQLLPVGPVSLSYLASSPERVDANVAEAGGDAAYAGPLGVYVLMYSALGGEGALAAAERAAAALPDQSVDDGTSRSGILAWLAAAGIAAPH